MSSPPPQGTLRGERVLVTGGDGFIGSHLVERLLAEGAAVRALALYNRSGNTGWLEEVDPEAAAGDSGGTLDVRLGDIRDAEYVRRLVADVDVVFHLAALISIPHSYEAPRSHVETNLMGTLNVLEAVRDSDARRMVHTSTSEVYGTPSVVPITEKHELKGQSPYSASKIGADKLVESYVRTYEVPAVVLRPFNTYGPRQSSRAVIPTVLSQLLAGQTELRIGSLTPRRDFTYVDDTVDGFVRMAVGAIEPGTVIHLGTGLSISVAELIERCVAITGNDARVVTQSVRTRPGASEIEVLQSDPSRAAEILGWAPTVDLDRGLRLVADWLTPRIDPARAAKYAL